ncbi:DUF6134 family protein [Spirosoma luteum]|uniref:DUF6134 family protein n=1 Tax=Spirosoma luteum TaxID=431553 RepID=UPI00037C05BF|nr:DUF6134 family protein [Spirosoma luteum]
MMTAISNRSVKSRVQEPDPNFRKRPKTGLLILIILVGTPLVGLAQVPDSTQIRRFIIDIAGIKVGTMTAVRQPKGNQTVQYTIISDVSVNLLVYKVKVYYKMVSLMQQGKLLRSIVEAQTNKGNFLTRTEWKNDHYDIVAEQYKYSRKTTETRPITYILSNVYFGEPVGRSRIYSEYFGDYFAFSSPTKGAYTARLSDREDEYEYEGGQLVKIIKKNSLRNFIIRPVR